jgi:hypothetical protein
MGALALEPGCPLEAGEVADDVTGEGAAGVSRREGRDFGEFPGPPPVE